MLFCKTAVWFGFGQIGRASVLWVHLKFTADLLTYSMINSFVPSCFAKQTEVN